MASISEDCTVKLWNVKNLDQQYQESEGNLEPYITLRGHTGPLFSITAPANSAKHGRVIYTAGSEGAIRVWNLPAIDEVNQYGDTYDAKNYCIGQWTEATGEAFWEIRHHPYSVWLFQISLVFTLEHAVISQRKQPSACLEHSGLKVRLLGEPWQNHQQIQLLGSKQN